MAALANAEYYNEVYRGVQVVDNLDVLLERASDIVRQQCCRELNNLETLPLCLQEYVRKAVCAQVEYIDLNGGLEWLNTSNASSFSIGKFSLSGGSSASNSSAGRAIVSNISLAYLEQAGLLYRGVNVL